MMATRKGRLRGTSVPVGEETRSIVWGSPDFLSSLYTYKAPSGPSSPGSPSRAPMVPTTPSIADQRDYAIYSIMGVLLLDLLVLRICVVAKG